MIGVEAQVSGCQCTCNHCLTYGHKNNFNMSMEDVKLILKNMKEYSDEGFFFPLFDVTNHPKFIEILELSNKYGYKRDTLSTNGVHEFTEDEFQAMKDMGIKDIQLAFHGIGQTHDNFVHYKGAYNKLLSLINKAGEFGFHFWNILFIHKKNINDMLQLCNKLKNMKYIRNGDFGLATYQYMGRAMKLKDLQFTKDAFKKLECKDDIVFSRKYYTEGEWLEVAKQSEWNKQAFIYDSSNINLFIDRKFDVYFSRYNPYSFYGLPDAEKGFKLGNIKDESLSNIIERINIERPPYIKALENISIPELAEEVGKDENIVYTYIDIPQYKWPYEFIKKQFSQGLQS